MPNNAKKIQFDNEELRSDIGAEILSNFEQNKKHQDIIIGIFEDRKDKFLDLLVTSTEDNPSKFSKSFSHALRVDLPMQKAIVEFMGQSFTNSELKKEILPEIEKVIKTEVEKQLKWWKIASSILLFIIFSTITLSKIL